MRKLAKSVFDRLPRPIRRRLQDRLEDLRRRRPERHQRFADYGLTPAQIYPDGVNFDDALRAGMAAQLEGLVIRKETPVASIGSCFADEFAFHMRRERFNYVTAEEETFPASANWGRVFTIAGFRQIAMYSSGDDVPLVVERSHDGWFDPLRERAAGMFETREIAEEAIRRHRAASRAALATARVLILTLGQNEAWIDRRSEVVWAERPPRTILDADRDRFEVRAFSFEENTAWLRDALARLRTINEALDVLLTVSPVASFATFAAGEAITQSFAGKCILRAVADRVVRTEPRVWYFPSFEMTLGYNPRSFNADNRHVKNATVDRIFKLLHATVVR